MVRFSAAWSCFLALIALVALAAASTSDYPGVIELVGYSNRRARTYFQESPRSQPNPNPSLTGQSAKTRADIETVKRNIRKYDRLLELDTKNLPEQQKDMLARIVERVARLKESLDIEEQQFNRQEATSSRSSPSFSSTTAQQQPEAETEAGTERDQEQDQSTQSPTGATEAETDPTLILDETTLLELQNTMNEQAAMSTIMKELPTTTDVSQQEETEESEVTEETEGAAGETTSLNLTTQSEQATTSDESLTDSTDPDDQFVAARSNNNIAAITAADDGDGSSTTTTANAGSQQRTLTTMGKLKNRATKRPFAHKVTAALKRGGQRPSSVSAAAANAAAASKPSSSTTSAASSSSTTQQKQKLATTSSFQQKQQQSKPLQKVTPSIGVASSSSGASSSSSAIPSATTNSASPALPIEQLYTRTPQANIPLAAAAAAAAAGAAGAAGSAASPSTYGSQQDSMVYDGHVNASALIDSLNTNAREEYYQQKLAAGNKDNKVRIRESSLRDQWEINCWKSLRGA